MPGGLSRTARIVWIALAVLAVFVAWVATASATAGFAFLFSAPIALASGSDWTTLLFPLHGPGGLTHFATGIPGCAPGGSLESLLANTTAIRIIHNPDFAPNGSPVVAQLGVDNITAVQVVPEPATVLLVGSGALVLLAVGRRRVRR